MESCRNHPYFEWHDKLPASKHFHTSNGICFFSKSCVGFKHNAHTLRHLGWNSSSVCQHTSIDFNLLRTYQWAFEERSECFMCVGFGWGLVTYFANHTETSSSFARSERRIWLFRCVFLLCVGSQSAAYCDMLCWRLTATMLLLLLMLLRHANQPLMPTSQPCSNQSATVSCAYVCVCVFCVYVMRACIILVHVTLCRRTTTTTQTVESSQCTCLRLRVDRGNPLSMQQKLTHTHMKNRWQRRRFFVNVTHISIMLYHIQYKLETAIFGSHGSDTQHQAIIMFHTRNIHTEPTFPSFCCDTICFFWTYFHAVLPRHHCRFECKVSPKFRTTQSSSPSKNRWHSSTFFDVDDDANDVYRR